MKEKAAGKLPGKGMRDSGNFKGQRDRYGSQDNGNGERIAPEKSR